MKSTMHMSHLVQPKRSQNLAKLASLDTITVNTKNQYLNLLLLGNNTFVVSGPDVLECTFEVTLWAIEVGVGLVFGIRKVRVDELNKSV